MKENSKWRKWNNDQKRKPIEIHTHLTTFIYVLHYSFIIYWYFFIHCHYIVDIHWFVLKRVDTVFNLFYSVFIVYGIYSYSWSFIPLHFIRSFCCWWHFVSHLFIDLIPISISFDISDTCYDAFIPVMLVFIYSFSHWCWFIYSFVVIPHSFYYYHSLTVDTDTFTSHFILFLFHLPVMALTFIIHLVIYGDVTYCPFIVIVIPICCCYPFFILHSSCCVISFVDIWWYSLHSFCCCSLLTLHSFPFSFDTICSFIWYVF